MEFVINKIQKSINSVMRQIGYTPAYLQKPGEISIVRQLTRNNYPRFHLYVKEKPFVAAAPQGENETISFIFSLHLDQKKPSYKGAKGHNGEYDGKVIEEEIERIKKLLEVE